MSTTLQEDLLQTTMKQAATIALLELQLRQAQTEIEALKSAEPSPQATPDLLREVRQAIEMHLKVDGCVPANCWPEFAHQTLSKISEILSLPEIPIWRVEDPAPKIRAALQDHRTYAASDAAWPRASWDALQDISKILGEETPRPVPHMLTNALSYTGLFNQIVDLLGCSFDVDSVWSQVRAQTYKVNRIQIWMKMRENGTMSDADVLSNIVTEVGIPKTSRSKTGPTISSLQDDLLVERTRHERVRNILENVRHVLNDPNVEDPLSVLRRLMWMP
jgi:hypothetical protein